MTEETMQRRSPVLFPNPPDDVAGREMRKGWDVILQYHSEGETGPFLVDLSHRDRWEIRGEKIDRIRPLEMTLPETPGQCRFQGGVLLLRFTGTSAGVWQLLIQSPFMPREDAYTDMTDGDALLALAGPHLSGIMEKITPLDLAVPAARPPFQATGPVCGIPGRIIVLDRNPDDAVMLITCPRGYGQAVADALLKAGKSAGLTPAGEQRMLDRLRALQSAK